MRTVRHVRTEPEGDPTKGILGVSLAFSLSVTLLAPTAGAQPPVVPRFPNEPQEVTQVHR